MNTRRNLFSSELYPIDYGEAFPWDEVTKDDAVYMVDFCLQPYTDMIKLAEKVQKLVWIDHHKTAIDEHIRHTPDNQLIFSANTRLGIGACRLVWEYFFPHLEVPYSIKLLAEADVGIWDDPQALNFKYGMSARPTDPLDSIWRALFENRIFPVGIANDGRVIQAFSRRKDADDAKAIAFETEFDGLRLIAANKAKPNSGFLYSLYDRELHDAMACFYWKQDRWLMDMYTKRDDLDLGAICKKWGGGGHKKAAGLPLTDESVGLFTVNPFSQCNPFNQYNT